MSKITVEELAFWKHAPVTKLLIRLVETAKKSNEELILNFSPDSRDTLFHLGRLRGFKDALTEILDHLKDPSIEILNDTAIVEENENELDKD